MRTGNHTDAAAGLQVGDYINQIMDDRLIDLIAERVMVKMGVKVSEEEKVRREEAERRRLRRSRMPESPISIKAIMKRIQEEDASLPSVPASDEEDLPWETEAKEPVVKVGLDSVLVAKALQWMACTHDLSLNGSQIQTILYNAYGVWLATKGERLLEEHPQVWQYGPVFPRAYKHLKKNAGNGQVEYDMLKTECPDRFEFIRRCFQRFAWTSAGVLCAPHTAEDSPWKQTKDQSPDKLGVRIEDELIRQWFLPRV
jgi:uncharacterized phage-associated protein